MTGSASATTATSSETASAAAPIAAEANAVTAKVEGRLSGPSNRTRSAAARGSPSASMAAHYEDRASRASGATLGSLSTGSQAPLPVAKIVWPSRRKQSTSAEPPWTLKVL